MPGALTEAHSTPISELPCSSGIEQQGRLGALYGKMLHARIIENIKFMLRLGQNRLNKG